MLSNWEISTPILNAWRGDSLDSKIRIFGVIGERAGFGLNIGISWEVWVVVAISNVAINMIFMPFGSFAIFVYSFISVF